MLQLVQIQPEIFTLSRKGRVDESDEFTNSKSEASKGQKLVASDPYSLLNLAHLRYKASQAQIKSACTFSYI